MNLLRDTCTIWATSAWSVRCCHAYVLQLALLLEFFENFSETSHYILRLFLSDTSITVFKTSTFEQFKTFS